MKHWMAPAENHLKEKLKFHRGIENVVTGNPVFCWKHQALPLKESEKGLTWLFFFFNDTKGWTQSLTYARKACYHMSHSPSPGFETGSHFMPTAWTVIYLFVLLCLSGMTVVGIPHPAFSWDGGGGVSHELFARFGLEPRSSQSLPLK
jgi:hypothetical protein